MVHWYNLTDFISWIGTELSMFEDHKVQIQFAPKGCSPPTLLLFRLFHFEISGVADNGRHEVITKLLIITEKLIMVNLPRCQ